MHFKKWLVLLIWAGLIVDTGYTFLQHRQQPLDGDMASIILPSPYYEPVMASPFGTDAILGDSPYASPNRFFVHWAMYHYFRSMPMWLGGMTNPVDGVYLSAALAKTTAHVLLLTLLSWLISRKGKRLDWLVAAALLAPLFQSSGYYQPLIGLVEPAPTYAFFYAWPAVLMLALLALVLRRWERPENSALQVWEVLLISGLVIVLPFTGPLVPGIILVVATIGGSRLLFGLLKSGRRNSLAWLGRKLPPFYWISIFILVILGVYSLFLGTLSTEQQHDISISERFLRLPSGMWAMLTNKPILPLLIAATGWQFFQLRKARDKAYTTEVRYLLMFILLYLALLPLGGYRDYRPDILRRDTVQPVLIALFYLWAKSGLNLLRVKKYRAWALIPTLGLWLLLIFADLTDVSSTPCHEKTLESIANTEQDTIVLSSGCPILTWKQIPDQDTRPPSKLLELWGILEEGQFFTYSGE